MIQLRSTGCVQRRKASVQCGYAFVHGVLQSLIRRRRRVGGFIFDAAHATDSDGVLDITRRQVRREDDAQTARHLVAHVQRAGGRGARQEQARAHAVRPVQPESRHHAPP